jgi:hypothetical protein
LIFCNRSSIVRRPSTDAELNAVWAVGTSWVTSPDCRHRPMHEQFSRTGDGPPAECNVAGVRTTVALHRAFAHKSCGLASTPLCFRRSRFRSKVQRTTAAHQLRRRRTGDLRSFRHVEAEARAVILPGSNGVLDCAGELHTVEVARAPRTHAGR